MDQQPENASFTEAATNSETPPLEEPSLVLSLRYWPPFLAAMLIASGILALGGGEYGKYLVWAPLAVFIGWLAIGYLYRPRPKAEEPEYEEPVLEDYELPAPVAQSASPEEVAEKTEAPAAPVVPPKAATSKPAALSLDGISVVVLWGSETGNAQGLAEMAATRLTETGMPAKAVSMGEVTVANLPAISRLLLITSTWGDGEPPSNAIDLWEGLQKEKVDLSKTHFSVLSLGDTSYPQFCKCGKDFDEFLAEQGAKRIHPRVDCDLDYEAPFEQWFSGASKALQSQPVGV